MFGRKKKKKGNEPESLFRKEAYIPKKKLNKKERTVPTPQGSRGRQEEVKKPTGIVRKIVVTLLWLFFCGEIIFVLFFANFFTVNNFEVKNEGDTLSTEMLKAYVAETTTGEWHNFISKNNLFLLQTKKQEERLLARYPKLSTVNITKQFPHTVSITATEKVFQVLWCSKEHCFLVNEEGMTADAAVFFQYPEEQGLTVRIRDVSETPTEIGRRVLTKEEFNFLGELSTSFPMRTGLSLEGSLEQPTPYAKEFRARTNKGFTLFFNTALPVDESLNTLMLILEKEVPEGEWEKINYIDLRTENRVYYTRHDRAPEKTDEQKKREEEEEKKRKEEEEKQNQGQ